MVNGSQGTGMSGSTFDAFVSSQRAHDETDWAAKIQEKYWRARQKFLAKIERNEDSNIVLSDTKLDSKLGIYKSIDRSCARLTNILENYQNCLFVFSNEENALGILLKECGKHDTTKAGKIMAVSGRSLTQSSHQRIRLYMPLMRFYQEMETFHSRAVDDTSETVDKLESKRSQYRASLLWMKDISEKLDPDVYKQLDKFRRVQNKVREDKRAFDGMQMDVVQKIDLLMASRCNLMNQILAPYQAILLETFEKNYNNFKSVQELIEQEDIYEYEFKALKQLNPLKIDDDSQKHNRPQLETRENQASNSEVDVAVEQDLLGDGGDDLSDQHGGDDNNNVPQGDNLVDVSGEVDSESKAASRTIESTKNKDVDLLDSLFGDHQDEEDLPQNQSRDAQDDKSRRSGTSSLRQRKPTKPGEYKAMRPCLDTNLFDIEGDEDKQIASLLGPSMNSQSATNLEHLMDPMSSRIEEDDIFAKWARDADIDLSDRSETRQKQSAASVENSTGDDSRTQDGLDRNLMDIEPERDMSRTHTDRSRFHV